MGTVRRELSSTSPGLESTTWQIDTLLSVQLCEEESKFEFSSFPNGMFDPCDAQTQLVRSSNHEDSCIFESILSMSLFAFEHIADREAEQSTMEFSLEAYSTVITSDSWGPQAPLNVAQNPDMMRSHIQNTRSNGSPIEQFRSTKTSFFCCSSSAGEWTALLTVLFKPLMELCQSRRDIPQTDS